jgi:hypothetical protein
LLADAKVNHCYQNVTTRDNIMKILLHFLWVLVLVTTSASAAQLYRWVDANGKVEWRDTPPPASAAAKKVEQRRMGDNVTAGDDLPYSVQLAVKNHPVTLWATDCGVICTNARAHLNRRGIPYTDKNPQSDFEAFKKISPDGSVPLLQVGSSRLKGYLDSEWDSTLDYAGYPRTALVTPRPKPAAPAPKPAADGAKPTDGAKPADGTPTAAAPVPANPAATPPPAATK